MLPTVQPLPMRRYEDFITRSSNRWFCTTAPALSESFYPDSLGIARRILAMTAGQREVGDTELGVLTRLLQRSGAHDQPHINFQGPF